MISPNITVIYGYAAPFNIPPIVPNTINIMSNLFAYLNSFIKDTGYSLSPYYDLSLCYFYEFIYIWYIIIYIYIYLIFIYTASDFVKAIYGISLFNIIILFNPFLDILISLFWVIFFYKFTCTKKIY